MDQTAVPADEQHISSKSPDIYYDVLGFASGVPINYPLLVKNATSLR